MVKTKYNTNKKKKEKIGKYKKVYVPSSLGSSYDPELINKLSSYCSLIGIDRTKYISGVLAKELEGLIVTNDFITLEEPFYFNWPELKEKRIVKATEKPIQDINNYAVVKKVANNLDTFNKEFRTYCYENNKNIHRGLFIYPVPVFEESTLTLEEVRAYILLFNYKPNSNELEVSLIDFNEVDSYIDLKIQAEVYKKVFDKFIYYVENIVDEEGDLNIEVWASTFEIIENYQSIKAIEDSIATNSGFITAVKEINPNANVTSSTSEDLIKYMQVYIKQEKQKRVNNPEYRREIKKNSLFRILGANNKELIEFIENNLSDEELDEILEELDSKKQQD